jgi:hypothetical protein
MGAVTMRRLEARPLAERLASGTPIPAVRKLFVCSWCGGRDIAVQPDYEYKGPMDR